MSDKIVRMSPPVELTEEALEIAERSCLETRPPTSAGVVSQRRQSERSASARSAAYSLHVVWPIPRELLAHVVCNVKRSSSEVPQLLKESDPLAAH